MIENCRGLFMVRSVGWKVVLLVVVVHIVQTTLTNLLLFPNRVLAPIQNATFGLIDGTLQANIISMAIVFPILFFVGKLKFKDLALVPAKGTGDSSIVRGVIWTLVALAIVHAMALLLIVCGLGPFQFNTVWFSASGIGMLGRLVGQLFGNAFYEEVIFRAFLIPQLLLIVKKKKRKWSWTKCFWIALIVSQLIFALIHIPNRIYQGTYSDVGAFFLDQIQLLVLGAALAAVFLMTRNLYAAIGVHAITNVAPTIIMLPVVGVEVAAYFVVFVAYLVNKRAAQKKAASTS